LEVAEVAEKERGGGLQVGQRSLVVEAEEDQIDHEVEEAEDQIDHEVEEEDQIDHEVEEEVPKTPNCCWKATVRWPPMCD
jgi:hypothetical protein